jgi:hypothetical protein
MMRLNYLMRLIINKDVKKMATPKKDPKDYLKRGRPTKYTEELAKEICDAVGSNHEGLFYLIEQNPHWPSRSKVFDWLRKHPEFRDMYSQAKEDQVEVCVEYMQELTNEPHRYIDLKTGKPRPDVAMINAKMTALRWQAGRLKPRKYGDTKALDVVDAELDADCKKRYAEMDKKNKKDY